MLALWLNLAAGLSREHTNKVLQAFDFILLAVLRLCGAVLYATGQRHVQLPVCDIPHDIRTLYSRENVEPAITRMVCCPLCFSLIPRPIPWRCQYRESARSAPCGAELWCIRNTRNGRKWVPKKMYSTQNFEPWLRAFLDRSVIHESLRMTYLTRKHGPGPVPSEMRDVHDSPAWRALQATHESPYNLVFSIYIDWFNPFTNKIAGEIS